jgi:hypothetical protein
MQESDHEVIAIADPEAPSPNGANGEGYTGRDKQGRFKPGCKGGPGNPLGRRYAQCTRVLLETISDDDIAQITRTLVGQAIAGNTIAAKVLLDMAIKKVPASDTIIRVASDGTTSVSINPNMGEREWEEFGLALKRARAMSRREEIRLPRIPIPGPYPANAEGPEPPEAIHQRAFSLGVIAQIAQQKKEAEDAITTAEESP